MRAYNKVENNETMGEEGDGGEEWVLPGSEPQYLIVFSPKLTGWTGERLMNHGSPVNVRK